MLKLWNKKVKMSPNYNVKGKNYRIKSWKWKWRDLRPSMVTHTQNLCSAFIPSKVHTHTQWTHTHTHTHREHTHTAVNTTHTHTHREHTYGRSSGQPFFYVAAPGEQLGFGALLKGTSVMVLKVRERCTFTPPTYNSCRPETQTHNLSITSPSL